MALLELWVPVVVAAHAFALVWLVRAARLLLPRKAAPAAAAAAAAHAPPLAQLYTDRHADDAAHSPVVLQWRSLGCRYSDRASVLHGASGAALPGDMQVRPQSARVHTTAHLTWSHNQ